jgi:hypothetical protein
MHGCRPTGRVYEGGPHRAGVHICATQLQKKKNLTPQTYSYWAELTVMLHVLGAGKGYSVSCGKTDTPGSAHFPHFEGSFPAGGEFADPFLVRYSTWD